MKYAAFLRGINVGGRTSIKMDALRARFAALGFENVKTYIQSGNVVFEAEETDDRRLAAQIEAMLESEFFKTPVMVRSVDEIKKIIAANPFAAEAFEDKFFHVVFLADELPGDKAALLLSHNREAEQFAVRGREVYCLLRDGVADSLLGKKFIDVKLKTPATARNWRTVNKIVEL
jgi:uncharacterized protein (DUF1697 family)